MFWHIKIYLLFCYRLSHWDRLLVEKKKREMKNWNPTFFIPFCKENLLPGWFSSVPKNFEGRDCDKPFYRRQRPLSSGKTLIFLSLSSHIQNLYVYIHLSMYFLSFFWGYRVHIIVRFWTFCKLNWACNFTLFRIFIVVLCIQGFYFLGLLFNC